MKALGFFTDCGVLAGVPAGVPAGVLTGVELAVLWFSATATFAGVDWWFRFDETFGLLFLSTAGEDDGAALAGFGTDAAAFELDESFALLAACDLGADDEGVVLLFVPAVDCAVLAAFVSDLSLF